MNAHYQRKHRQHLSAPVRIISPWHCAL
jgi:hypothetical protein